MFLTQTLTQRGVLCYSSLQELKTDVPYKCQHYITTYLTKRRCVFSCEDVKALFISQKKEKVVRVFFFFENLENRHNVFFLVLISCLIRAFVILSKKELHKTA